MVMPSGRRNSEPVPVPSASGRAPNIAAMVVIMMGAETQQTGLEDGLHRALALVALGLKRKVDHHDSVLLHNANEQDNADHGDEVQRVLQSISASRAPRPADGSVERMVTG